MKNEATVTLPTLSCPVMKRTVFDNRNAIDTKFYQIAALKSVTSSKSGQLAYSAHD